MNKRSTASSFSLCTTLFNWSKWNQLSLVPRLNSSHCKVGPGKKGKLQPCECCLCSRTISKSDGQAKMFPQWLCVCVNNTHAVQIAAPVKGLHSVIRLVNLQHLPINHKVSQRGLFITDRTHPPCFPATDSVCSSCSIKVCIFHSEQIQPSTQATWKEKTCTRLNRKNSASPQLKDSPQ